MRKGSITVFSTLIMVLVASVLFVLLEAARVQEIQHISQLQTDMALEAVFADYDALLWREYQLLASDVTNIEESLIFYGNARAGAPRSGLNLFQTNVEDVAVTQLTRLTDGRGKVFRKAAAMSMKEALGFGIAQEIFNQYEVVKDLVETSAWNPAWIDVGASQPFASEGMNPLKIVQFLQGINLLSLVSADEKSLSANTVFTDNLVTNRTVEMGITPKVEELTWMEEILFQQYLLKHMSNYLNPKQERGFAYELEYILGGTSSDVENLNAVVTQILFIREIANFVYLTLDQTKYQEVSTLALVLAGLSANPAVIETIKIGLLTAWAFGESILDVRALLRGKNVPLLKNTETWTLELEQIASIINKDVCAKESKWGISYEEYLGILLLFQDKDIIAFHAMDVQEATLRKQLQDPTISIDQFIVQAGIEMKYCFRSVFLKNEVPWSNHVNTKSSYSYN